MVVFFCVCVFCVCVCVCVVYDVLTGAVVARLCGHDACVRDVSWHPYQDSIVSSSVSRPPADTRHGPPLRLTVPVWRGLTGRVFLTPPRIHS